MPAIEIGQALTIWTARAAAALYVAAVVFSIRRRRAAASALMAGFLIYLAHVALAFQFFYDWSHSFAYRETARQTLDLFGVEWGGGLYLNYLFTILWGWDCLLSRTPESQGSKRFRLRLAVHAFLAFMVVNATVVVWVLRGLQ